MLVERIDQAGSDQRIVNGVQALRRLPMTFARLVRIAGSMVNVDSGHGGVTGCYDRPQFNNSTDF